MAAEATRLERALTNPLEIDDRDDLSPAPATEATEATEPTEEARAPKKKPAKRKSPSKTTAEGMSSQYSVPWSLTESCLVVDRPSSEASVTLPDGYESTAIPTASITTNIADPTPSNSTTTNTETASMSMELLSGK